MAFTVSTKINFSIKHFKYIHSLYLVVDEQLYGVLLFSPFFFYKDIAFFMILHLELQIFMYTVHR